MMSETRTIIVAEDHPDVLGLFAQCRELIDHHNESSPEGPKLQLEIYNDPAAATGQVMLNPDCKLLILDLNFRESPNPASRGISGQRVFQAIRSARPDITIATFTAYDPGDSATESEKDRYGFLKGADRRFIKSHHTPRQIIAWAIEYLSGELPEDKGGRLHIIRPDQWMLDLYEQRLGRATVDPEAVALVRKDLRDGERLKMIVGPATAGKTRLGHALDQYRRQQVRKRVRQGKYSEQHARDVMKEAMERIACPLIRRLTLENAGRRGYVSQPRIIAYTDRSVRKKEVHGVHYYFASSLRRQERRAHPGRSLFEVTMLDGCVYQIWTEAVQAALTLADALSELIDEEVFILSINRSPAYEKLRSYLPQAAAVGVVSSLSHEPEKLRELTARRARRRLELRDGAELPLTRREEIALDHAITFYHHGHIPPLIENIIENPEGKRAEDLLQEFLDSINHAPRR